MRVGISFFSTADQSIWSNGIGQNAIFLAKLIRSIPFVEQTYIIDCSEQKGLPADAQGASDGIAVGRPNDIQDSIDVAIEVGGGLDMEWIRRFRARGGKVAHHICGQPYAALVEPSIFNKPAYWAEPQRADEIWLLPKDAQFRAMLQGIYRQPVHITPYIWSSCFLQETMRVLNSGGSEFGYRRGDCGKGARIAIFEPNISPIKTFSMALLICEMVERENPEIISDVCVMNCKHLEGQPTFDYFIKNLELWKAGKICLLGRDYIAKVMAERANLVVAQQLECAQNYLYFDALYGGYPIIHNSSMFSDIGYYYRGNDVEDSARRLLQACARHDLEVEDYARRAQATLAEADSSNAQNIDAYARRLIALTANRAH
jgi:hypothetical protein